MSTGASTSRGGRPTARGGPDRGVTLQSAGYRAPALGVNRQDLLTTTERDRQHLLTTPTKGVTIRAVVGE